jgi:hypothetical protein
MVRLWQITGRDDLKVLIESWYASRIETGLPTLNVNTTAPMLGLSVLWKETRDPRWAPVLDTWANRVVTEMGRTNAAHMGSGGVTDPGPESKKVRRNYETAPAGNAVVLEEQLLKMGENYADHRLMTNLYQKNIDMLKISVK